jgi:hypothetical protein
MLLPKNTNPAYSTYYYGAVVLKILLASEDDAIDFLSLYQKVSSVKRISIQAFVLTLDWLYLTESINLDNNGMIKKCF